MPSSPSFSTRVLLFVAVVFAADVGTASADSPRDLRLRQRLSSNVLRWAGDAEGGAPFQFHDPENPERLLGFEVEIVEALVGQLRDQLNLPQLRAEFVQYEWVNLPQGLEKRDFDVIVSGLEITDENRAKMVFSRPYYVYSQVLTVRADETRIRSVDDLRELPVGTLATSAANGFLTEHGAKKIVTYDGQIEPYQDLALNRLDAVLLDLPIAVQNASGDPRFKFVEPRMGHGHYGIGLNPSDGDLAAAFDEGLSELMRSGRLRDIYTKWKLWNDDQMQLALPGRADETAGLRRESHVATENASHGNWTFSHYAPPLLAAAGVTVALTAVSMAVAMTIGLVVAVCRLYGPRFVQSLALAYVEFFRGTPLLLLLTFLYYGLPSIGIVLEPWQAAILGFGLNYAAFEAEIYRSSILAVPRGQWEAAYALGMNDVTTFRRVIFPQAFRTALGPMTNDFVAMFKDTSLVSVISVVELTKQYNILARSSLKFVEIGALTALLYLLMSVPLGYLARYLEDRWSAGHR